MVKGGSKVLGSSNSTNPIGPGQEDEGGLALACANYFQKIAVIPVVLVLFSKTRLTVLVLGFSGWASLVNLVVALFGSGDGGSDVVDDNLNHRNLVM